MLFLMFIFLCFIFLCLPFFLCFLPFLSAYESSESIEVAENSSPFSFLTEYDSGPSFDLTTPREVTVLVGKTAFLSCSVRNRGNKTVSNWQFLRKTTFFRYILFEVCYEKKVRFVKHLWRKCWENILPLYSYFSPSDRHCRLYIFLLGKQKNCCISH